jgi:hypothetical protein
MASQAELDAHINDTTDAHDASAISILDAAADFTATDVEGALAELQSDHEADATALSDHISDATAAHAATAISVDSTNLVGTSTTVQGSLDELDNAIVATETVANAAIPKSIIDAKGDLIGGTAADTSARLAVGTDGKNLVADSAETTGLKWKDAPGSYCAAMYVANSGSPTNTSSGSPQKVGSGGGTATYTSEFDERPSGATAQCDTANKQLDVQRDGIYQVSATITFSALASGATAGVLVYVNGAVRLRHQMYIGGAGSQYVSVSGLLSLAAGDYIELYATQNDSASEAYVVTSPAYNRISMALIRPS